MNPHLYAFTPIIVTGIALAIGVGLAINKVNEGNPGNSIRNLKILAYIFAVGALASTIMMFVVAEVDFWAFVLGGFVLVIGIVGTGMVLSITSGWQEKQ